MKNKIPHLRILLLLIFLAGALLCGCSRKEKPSGPGMNVKGPNRYSADTSGIEGTVNVARQIVYDVEIINPYPDDTWTSECLKGLDRGELVGFVFDGIYSGRFSTYDIFEGTPITSKKIRKMEEKGEFSRDRIGKFQFMEEWILDTLNMSFTKQVTEIRMGLQKFNADGELTGYAPLLRVVL